MLAEEYIFETKINSEMIDAYGHVNNAAYLVLFENARWNLINENGYGIEKIKKTGLGPVILEIHIKFVKELFLDDLITIKTQFVSYNGKVGKIHQKMFRDDELCCEANIIIALLDLKTRRIVAPSKEWLEAIGVSK